LKQLYAFNDTVFRVIRLKTPIPVNSNQVLAVTYTALPITGPNRGRGNAIQVGGNLLTTAGVDSGRIVMKLLRVTRELQVPTPDLKLYDTTATFAPVRELELKNIYNLGGFQIDPQSFKL